MNTNEKPEIQIEKTAPPEQKDKKLIIAAAVGIVFFLMIFIFAIAKSDSEKSKIQFQKERAAENLGSQFYAHIQDLPESQRVAWIVFDSNLSEEGAVSFDADASNYRLSDFGGIAYKYASALKSFATPNPSKSITIIHAEKNVNFSFRYSVSDSGEFIALLDGRSGENKTVFLDSLEDLKDYFPAMNVK